MRSGPASRLGSSFALASMATDSNRPRTRCEVRFAGQVQGVGFRYTTRQIAGRFDVGGYVQNLPDGSVLLVAEGMPDVVNAFIDAVRDEMDRYITSSQDTQFPATGEFTRFEVKF